MGVYNRIFISRSRNGHALGMSIQHFIPYYDFHYILVYMYYLGYYGDLFHKYHSRHVEFLAFKIKKIKLSVILYSNIFITLAFSFLVINFMKHSLHFHSFR